MGRFDEARTTLARFGAAVRVRPEEAEADTADTHEAVVVATTHGLLGTSIALTLAAIAWGFVNFGVLLWLPAALVAEGRSVGLASTIIARSTLIAAPTVLITTYLYTTWSTKYSLLTAIGITVLGLIAILLRGVGTFSFLSNPIVPLSLLIVGSTAVISILLPYAAENYPIRVRGRATGWVAGWSKIGGLIAQGLGALALVPALGSAAAIVALPAMMSLVLIAVAGRETRGRDLRELESGQVAQQVQD
jgi:putative MFS transporter